MKKIFTLCMACLIALAGLAQDKTRSRSLLNNLDNASVKSSAAQKITGNEVVNMPYKVSSSSKAVALAAEEIEVGKTRYDLQSNSCIANRYYRYDDGCIAATWTGGRYVEPNFNDRGSFYNYWNGQAWTIDPESIVRIENERTGWPSYAPYGDGEIVVAHGGSNGVRMHKRDVRGQGSWNMITATVGNSGGTWPGMCVNNGTIHVLEAGQTGDGAQRVNSIWYSRSKDGGQTWAPQGVTPDAFGPDYCSPRASVTDCYAWAEPNNGIIAYALFETMIDLVIMKSVDDGDTWQRIEVWKHPIPKFDYVTTAYTDTLWCPNGTGSIVIDDYGKCHVAFGVCRQTIEEASPEGYHSTFYYDGCVMYWNEDLLPFSAADQYRALDPETHPMYMEDGRCVLAFGFDFDNDGTWIGEMVGDVPVNSPCSYNAGGPFSCVSMTQVSEDRLIIAVGTKDERSILTYNGSTYIASRIFLCTYKYNDEFQEWAFDPTWKTDPDMKSYDLWTSEEKSNAGWYGMIKGFEHFQNECVHPQVLAQRAPKGSLEGNVYVFFNVDTAPGDGYAQNNPQLNNWTDNTIVMWLESMDFTGASKPEKPLTGIKQHETAKQQLEVYPNPAANTVNVVVTEAANCIIYNMAGQAVAKQALSAGNNTINISNMKAGVYFISAGNSNAKLVVK